jgi:hypothetical protein
MPEEFTSAALTLMINAPAETSSIKASASSPEATDDDPAASDVKIGHASNGQLGAIAGAGPPRRL